ncbi:MAG: D-amino-acid transaminase [Parvibaculales bacterium]
MAQIAYIDGHYLPLSHAGVNVEDRGYQFSDGVYEVFALRHGKLVDEEAHLDRLEKSLYELNIVSVMSRPALKLVIRETIRKNNLAHAHGFGVVYLQITRGVAPRNHIYPDNMRPILVITVRSQNPRDIEKIRENGIEVISHPDLRWARCDIKSISLLPNILARQQAKKAQAQEAWLVDEQGFVTEGAATNAWIVTQQDVLLTRQAEDNILPGITRAVLMDTLSELGLSIETRAFTIEEAQQAKEAFSTASTMTIFPVVRIDGKPVQNGKPGALSLQLFDAYQKKSIKS